MYLFSYYFVYMSEDDISTTCLHNDVLARSLTQFVVVAFFFLRQRQRPKNERRRCMNHQVKGMRTYAHLYHLITIKKGLMAGELWEPWECVAFMSTFCVDIFPLWLKLYRFTVSRLSIKTMEGKTKWTICIVFLDGYFVKSCLLLRWMG